MLRKLSQTCRLLKHHYILSVETNTLHHVFATFILFYHTFVDSFSTVFSQMQHMHCTEHACIKFNISE